MGTSNAAGRDGEGRTGVVVESAKTDAEILGEHGVVGHFCEGV